MKKCSLEAEALMLRRYYSASVAIRQGLEGNGTGGSLICSDYSKSSAARGREVSERRRRVLTSTSSPPLIQPPPSAPPPSLVPPGDWLSVTGPEMLLLVKPTASAGRAGGRAGVAKGFRRVFLGGGEMKGGGRTRGPLRLICSITSPDHGTESEGQIRAAARPEG